MLWDLVAGFSWPLGSAVARSNVKMSLFWCSLYPVISFLINLAFSRMLLHQESCGEGMAAAVPAPAYPLPFCSCFALFESDQVTVQSRICLGIQFFFATQWLLYVGRFSSTHRCLAWLLQKLVVVYKTGR